jgi:hypothetical protein
MRRNNRFAAALWNLGRPTPPADRTLRAPPQVDPAPSTQSTDAPSSVTINMDLSGLEARVLGSSNLSARIREQVLRIHTPLPRASAYERPQADTGRSQERVDDRPSAFARVAMHRGGVCGLDSAAPAPPADTAQVQARIAEINRTFAAASAAFRGFSSGIASASQDLLAARTRIALEQSQGQGPVTADELRAALGPSTDLELTIDMGNRDVFREMYIGSPLNPLRGLSGSSSPSRDTVSLSAEEIARLRAYFGGEGMPALTPVHGMKTVAPPPGTPAQYTPRRVLRTVAGQACDVVHGQTGMQIKARVPSKESLIEDNKGTEGEPNA